MRFILAGISALFISVSMFFGMQVMISSDGKKIEHSEKPRQLSFLREKKDSQLEKKKRVKPKEPKKKPTPKKLKIVKTQKMKVNKEVKLKPFKIAQKKIDISSINSLSGAQIDLSGDYLDAFNLKALKRVNPKYPRRAKLRRIEGYVQLAFTISKEGLVSNIRVLESKPKETFEKASISAIKKWKFKPHKEVREASIKFNFRLAQ